MIGLLPLLLAVIGANRIFDAKNKNQLFVLSMALLFIISLLLGMMPLIPGLALLGFMCSILAGSGLQSIKNFSDLSKYSLNKIILPFLIIVFALTTFIPFIEANINQDLPSENKLEAMDFLSEVDGTIISSPDEAHMIMYFSGKKTYFDSYYAFSNAQERYDNSLIIYRGNSIFEAGKVLSDERIDWIFLSNETRSFYGIEELKIAELSNCLELEFEEEVYIYENRCTIT